MRGGSDGPDYHVDIDRTNTLLTSFKLPTIPDDHNDILLAHEQKQPVVLSATIMKSIVTRIGILLHKPSRDLVSHLFQKVGSCRITNPTLAKLLEDHQPFDLEYQCQNLEVLNNLHNKDNAQQNPFSLLVHFRFSVET